MRRNEDATFSQPQHQPLSAIWVLIYDSFINILRQWWPVLLIIFFQRSSRWVYVLLFGAIGMALLSLAMSIIRYYRFRFHIDGNELNIEKGVFTQTHTNVPFQRVQSIDFEQKPIHRITGLVRFRIITAGAKDSEIEIPALKKSQAEELRSLILKMKQSLGGLDDGDTVEVPEERRELFRLGIVDLLKVGISVNHLKTAGVIIAIIWGLYWQLGEIVQEYSFENLISDYAREVNMSWLYYLLVLVPPFLLIAILVSIVIALFRFYALRVIDLGKSLKVISGLLNRKEQTALNSKLQIMNWITNPVRQMFDMYSIRLKQASSEQIGASESISIPGCYESQVDLIRDHYFPRSLDANAAEFKVQPELVQRYTLYFGLLPALLVSAIAWFSGNVYLYSIALWVPASWWVWSAYQRKWQILVDDEMLRTRSGIFGWKYELMQIYKVQSVATVQTPYMRRHGLANLQIFTAAGSLTIPYLKAGEAVYLSDLLLYKAESSRKQWM